MGNTVFGFSRGSLGVDRDQAARLIRSRQESHGAAIDRAARVPRSATARRLVQIYDGGAKPTSADHFFLSHPVELDGAETEGGGATPVVDTTQTLVVDVLGNVPAVGDLLTAFGVGGRWVAEMRGATGIPTYLCAGYYLVPRANLTISGVGLSGGVPYWSISEPFIYNAGFGTPSWALSCYMPTSISIGMGCLFGSLYLGVNFYSGPDCTNTSLPAPISCVIPLASYTAPPSFSAVFDSAVLGGGGSCGALFGSLAYPIFTVTYP